MSRLRSSGFAPIGPGGTHPAANRRDSMKAVQRRGITCAAVTAMAMPCVVVAPSAQAATPSRSLAAVPSGGVPAFVNPATDLAAQVLGPESTWVDSIFIAGRVHSGRHDFGILV